MVLACDHSNACVCVCVFVSCQYVCCSVCVCPSYDTEVIWFDWFDFVGLFRHCSFWSWGHTCSAHSLLQTISMFGMTNVLVIFPETPLQSVWLHIWECMNRVTTGRTVPHCEFQCFIKDTQSVRANGTNIVTNWWHTMTRVIHMRALLLSFLWVLLGVLLECLTLHFAHRSIYYFPAQKLIKRHEEVNKMILIWHMMAGKSI